MTSGGSFPSILNLNVGGIVYTTTLKTITRDPKSLLGRMFSGTHEVACDSKGNYFIDRDGALFRYVLNFLRSWELCLPQSFDEFEQLRAEADFYQVGDLIKALEELRGDRRKNKPLSEGLGTIIVYDRLSEDGRLYISGRLELVQEIFKEYSTESLEDPQERYVEDYPVSISNMAILFDLLSGYGFQLESCIHRPGTKYIFMRRK